MLPHILNSTARAAAAVQNQTHTIRNVLHLQSSGPSSGSGPSWGNGPGPGGSKFNTGSRFYTGYNSAGRAVTQANILTTQDGNFAQSDDNDESPPKRRVLPTTQKRHRMRSSSVSLSGTGRNERGEKMGVLKTVQLHTRSRHVFAPVETLASAKERLLAEAVDLGDVGSRPLLVRRNSTSAPLSPLLDPSPVHLPTPPPELDQASEEPAQVAFAPPVNKSTSTSATTRPVTPPPSPRNSSNDPYIATFLSCKDADSATTVSNTIRRMLQDPTPPELEHFNAALRALNRTRRPGEPLTATIRLYNSILDASMVPNIDTYECLILALTSRDFEVHHAILSLEMRLKKEYFLYRTETTTSIASTKARLKKLKTEDNLGSAMSLFESILAVNDIRSLYKGIFTVLIRSCAFHCNVKAAIHVFAQLERRNAGIDYPVFRYMIITFSGARMIRQAEETFSEFLTSRNGKKIDLLSLHSNRREQIRVWNAMIETYFRAGMPDKAIELLERMLASTAGDQFGPMDTPIVTPSTFTTVILGFIKGGDISSALAWFERLLAQKNVAADPYEGLGGAPMRPDVFGWHAILDGLAKNGKIDDLNRLYRLMRSSAVQDRLEWRPVFELIVYSANMENLKRLDDKAALKVLNFIVEDISDPSSKLDIPGNLHVVTSLAEAFIQRGQFLAAAELTKKWFSTAYDPNSSFSSEVVQEMHEDLKRITQQISIFAKKGKGEPDFRTASIIVQLHIMLSLEITLDFAPWYLHAYGFARLIDVIDYSQLSPHGREVLLDCAVNVESATLAGTEGLTVVSQYAFKGVASLLEDLAHQGLKFSDINKELGRRTIELLQAQLGDAGCQELFSRLDPSYLEAFNHLQKIRFSALESALTQVSEPIATLQSPVQEIPPLQINKLLSDQMDTILRIRGALSQAERSRKAYNLLKQNLMRGQGPHPSMLSMLIQTCGRCNEVDKVHELYPVGQAVLQSLVPDQQLEAWVFLESSMIVALGHSGNIEAARAHRLRILDQGCTPSADAYGVLIQHVKDTTDDTSGAVALFLEALERGVKLNLYLYNNIISKLAKARKADYALELFQQMKANGCPPSAITYSAVIGACARVGDVQLAESLFSEMTKQFRPRVPAYNTMMQLFTTTKPNRASSLFYYSKLVKTGVEPSSYTYKLLMDTYGCLEPVDLPAMERVFQELQGNPNPDVKLTTGHFASLINAYGCVAKDFDKAIAVFQSISTYANAPPLDAIIFEAIINVLVAHRRVDLLPVYVSKMNEAGVHMTAYIANFLIRGYANMGDLDQARSIFESLRDPPSGIAAPNNHAPHHPEVSPDVHIMDVVYREPSTWEVMVRAELGVGNVDAALALLKRIKARQYPEAVYNRISGVMTDHSLPPIEPLQSPVQPFP